VHDDRQERDDNDTSAEPGESTEESGEHGGEPDDQREIEQGHAVERLALAARLGTKGAGRTGTAAAIGAGALTTGARTVTGGTRAVEPRTITFGARGSITGGTRGSIHTETGAVPCGTKGTVAVRARAILTEPRTIAAGTRAVPIGAAWPFTGARAILAVRGAGPIEARTVALRTRLIPIEPRPVALRTGARTRRTFSEAWALALRTV
jgi:hypothetical protein